MPATRVLAAIFCLLLGVSAAGAQGGLIGTIGQTTTALEAVLGKLDPAWRGRRVALVIGNSNYKGTSVLENPSRDARAVAKALRDSGFVDVAEHHDLPAEAMTTEIEKFNRLAQSADWAVVYYAGHGLEINGRNHLLGVDFGLSSAGGESVEMIHLLKQAGVARRLNLVILDACRNNPFLDMVAPAERGSGVLQNVRARSIEASAELPKPDSPMIVAYAAKHGSAALDGAEGHSPFAEAFIRYVKEPGLEIRQLLANVRDSVVKVTKGDQVPYIYGSLPSDKFHFNR